MSNDNQEKDLNATPGPQMVKEGKPAPIQEAPFMVNEDLLPPGTIHGLISNLHKILDDAQIVVNQYHKKSNAIDSREKNVLARELNIGAREKSLVEREAACKDVEDLKALRKQANTAMDAANLRLQAAHDAEKHLSTSTQEQKSLLQEQSATTQREANNVLVQRKAIEKEVATRVQAILSSMGLNPQAALPIPPVAAPITNAAPVETPEPQG